MSRTRPLWDDLDIVDVVSPVFGCGFRIDWAYAALCGVSNWKECLLRNEDGLYAEVITNATVYSESV
jgi:hypothetical protein